ncbi:NAD(P)H-dependent oxidoreductase [Streptomyces zhihengii]
MGWDPVVTAADYPDHTGRLIVADASHEALASGRIAPEVRAEQEKLLRADALVVQFPLWWYGPPAILKGWFDRVLVKGLGYGTGERYGAGALAGKRALTVVTAGARAPPWRRAASTARCRRSSGRCCTAPISTRACRLWSPC